jgi:hypothetical protein
MTNLALRELAAIAVALDEEECAERRSRRWAVHPAWRKRESGGELATLYKEVTEDEVKFYGYFRLNRGCFVFTRESGSITYKKTNESSKARFTQGKIGCMHKAS